MNSTASRQITVFIDGAHGTVGMALQPHLSKLQSRFGLRLLALEHEQGRDTEMRKEAMSQADIVVLCLPDDAAREAAQMACEVNARVRILDTSAAHRCNRDWVYGLPELYASPVDGAHAISQARFVANPGCFATGCILLARPLGGWLSSSDSAPWMAFQGITGYSAGGRKAQPAPEMPWMAQLGAKHRHLDEIEQYADVTPELTTMVGDWYNGMMVQSTNKLCISASHAVQCVQEAYENHPLIEVRDMATDHRRVSAMACNGTNRVIIAVAKQPNDGVTVVAAYDNLGKGSAGAAAQNLEWMLAGHSR